MSPAAKAAAAVRVGAHVTYTPHPGADAEHGTVREVRGTLLIVKWDGRTQPSAVDLARVTVGEVRP